MKLLRVALWICVAGLPLQVAAFAQDTTCFTGTVQDGSGSVLPTPERSMLLGV